jgi:Tol biopolymer transport system component
VRAALSLTVGVLTGFGIVTSLAPADDVVRSAPTGAIAYSDGTICLVRADGTGGRCLTHGDDSAPISWSADGRRLAFERSQDTSNPDDKSVVIIIGADGRHEKSITPPGIVDDYAPAWSPIAARLAFTRLDHRSGEPSAVVIANGNGSGARPLMRNAMYPKWSPNGRKIAFLKQSESADELALWVMDADGSKPRLVARHVVVYVFDWSPDGRKLVFDDRRGKAHVFVVNVDGTGLHRLTRAYREDAQPSWSPDGRKIAFSCSQKDEDICTVNADGSQRRRLTTNRNSDFYAAWSPDSKQIAYVGYGGAFGVAVYVMRSDGSMNRRVTRSSLDLPPSWKP